MSRWTFNAQEEQDIPVKCQLYSVLAAYREESAHCLGMAEQAAADDKLVSTLGMDRLIKALVDLLALECLKGTYPVNDKGRAVYNARRALSSSCILP
jgi:hypothetical protein